MAAIGQTPESEVEEPTQGYAALEGDNHGPSLASSNNNVLQEYYVIEGPEKLMEGAQSSNASQSSSDGPLITECSQPSRQCRANIDAKRETVNTSKHTLNPRADVVKDELDSSKKNVVSQTPPPTKFITVCPPVNCKEKIIVCLDLSEEMKATSFRSRAGDKYTGLDLAKRALKMFVMHKSQMNDLHEFAFLIFTEEPTMIQDFSSRPQVLLNTIEETEMYTQECGPLKMSKLFETIKENVELPSTSENIRVTPPPYIVRLLLVFGRSHCVPVELGTQAQKALEASPYFFTDVLYIHDPPSEENKCEEIFNALCQLDHNGLSYILEASKYTPIFTSGAKLLAHPLQRPLQEQAAYKIGSFPVAPPVPDERCI